MTTTTILVSAAIGTVWLIIIMAGVLGWIWMSRRKPASERKQQYKQAASKAEDAVNQKVFDSGLAIRLWKGAFNGVLKAGVTLLRRTDRNVMRQTMWVEHCFDIPSSLLFLCDELEKQTWLLDEDREQLPLLRAAMQAAEEVILEAKQERRQVNGHASVNSTAV